MSSERLERVRALIPPDGTDLAATFGVPGGVSAGGLVADDVPVRFVSASAEMAGAGPEGFYDRWADWLEPWESYRIYTEDVVERADRVVMLVRLVGVTKRDHVEMEHESAAVFRFEGERIAEIVFTMERGAALDD